MECGWSGIKSNLFINMILDLESFPRSNYQPGFRFGSFLFGCPPSTLFCRHYVIRLGRLKPVEEVPYYPMTFLPKATCWSQCWHLSRPFWHLTQCLSFKTQWNTILRNQVSYSWCWCLTRLSGTAMVCLNAIETSDLHSDHYVYLGLFGWPSSYSIGAMVVLRLVTGAHCSA